MFAYMLRNRQCPCSAIKLQSQSREVCSILGLLLNIAAAARGKRGRPTVFFPGEQAGRADICQSWEKTLPGLDQSDEIVRSYRHDGEGIHQAGHRDRAPARRRQKGSHATLDRSPTAAARTSRRNHAVRLPRTTRPPRTGRNRRLVPRPAGVPDRRRHYRRGAHGGPGCARRSHRRPDRRQQADP